MYDSLVKEWLYRFSSFVRKFKKLFYINKLFAKKINCLADNVKLFLSNRLSVKKTSIFGLFFGRFEKIKISGLHFASISHP